MIDTLRDEGASHKWKMRFWGEEAEWKLNIGETKDLGTSIYPFADTQNPRARPAMENWTLRQQKPQEELVSLLIK